MLGVGVYGGFCYLGFLSFSTLGVSMGLLVMIEGWRFGVIFQFRCELEL